MIEGVVQVGGEVPSEKVAPNVRARSILYDDATTGIRPMIALYATEEIKSGKRLVVEYDHEVDLSTEAKCFPRKVVRPKEFTLYEKEDQLVTPMKKMKEQGVKLTDATIAMAGGPPLTLLDCKATRDGGKESYALGLKHQNPQEFVGKEAALNDEKIPNETEWEGKKESKTRRKVKTQNANTYYVVTGAIIPQGVVIGLVKGAWAFHDILKDILPLEYPEEPEPQKPKKPKKPQNQYIAWGIATKRGHGLILDPPSLQKTDGPTVSCSGKPWQRPAQGSFEGEEGSSGCRLRRLICVPEENTLNLEKLSNDQKAKFNQTILHRHAVAVQAVAVQAVQAVATTSDDVAVAQAVAVGP